MTGDDPAYGKYILLHTASNIKPGGILCVRVPEYTQQRKKYLCKKIGVKRGRVFSQKGHIFESLRNLRMSCGNTY